MARAEFTSLPLTIAILVVAFGALRRGGPARAARVLRGARRHRAQQPRQPRRPDGPADAQRDHPHDRHGGRDRLLALLPAARARGAATPARRRTPLLLRAARTSGQAVLISGATVLIAMAGMFVSGNSLFTHDRHRDDDRRPRGDDRLAHRAARRAVTGSATRSTRAGSRSSAAARATTGRGRASSAACCAGRWSRLVLAGGALLVLALPALGMHTKLPNLTDLPHDLKIVRTYERIQQAFPGSQTPAVVVVKAPNVDTPQMRKAYALFQQRALATGELFAPFTVTAEPRPDGRADRLRDRRQRRQRGVDRGAAHAARHGDPADREDAARHRGGGDGRDRRNVRLQPPDARPAAVRLPVRARAGVRRCSCSRSGRS